MPKGNFFLRRIRSKWRNKFLVALSSFFHSMKWKTVMFSKLSYESSWMYLSYSRCCAHDPTSHTKMTITEIRNWNKGIRARNVITDSGKFAKKKKNVEFYLESTTTILAMLLLRGRNGSRWLDWKARQNFGAKEIRKEAGKNDGERKRGERERMYEEWKRVGEKSRREGSMRAMISRCVRLTGPKMALKNYYWYNPIYSRKDEGEGVNQLPDFSPIREKERKRENVSLDSRSGNIFIALTFSNE